MTIEAIRKLHDARPFQRFTLVLADGSRVGVRHPEALAHPGKGRTVIVFEGPEDFRVIDLLLVTALEVGIHATGRNGGSRRRAS